MLVKGRNALSFALLTLQTVLLSFLPEKRLYAKTLRAMEAFLRTDGLQTNLCFTSSGRAALSILFRYLRRRQEKPIDTVLLPDYICNAVCTAAEYAGLCVRFYKTTDYAPSMESIEQVLDECDNTCVLFASLMGHCCAHESLYAAVRSRHPHTPIVFDECQNLPGLRNALPTMTHQDIYCVVSFNNKMTPGLLGGAVYGLPREHCLFEPQIGSERRHIQFSMMISYVKQNMKALCEYMTGRYHAPDVEEKSTCEGKYSVTPFRIYRISLAAAYLGLRNWEKHEKTLKENERNLFRDNSEVQLASTGDNSIPLYIPIKWDSRIIGRYPIKGRYWTRVPCQQYQDHIYIIAHNTIKVHKT